jgi:hypothetical protein
MFKWKWLLVSLALVTALAFAACDDDSGNGDDGDDDTPVAEATEPSGDNGDGEETPDAEPTEDDGDDNGGNGGGDLGELEGRADDFANSTFRATYNVTGEGAPGSTMTLYKDGADRIRIDFSGGAEGDGSFIAAGENSYICFSGESAADLGVEGEGACIQSSSDTNPVGDLTDSLGDVELGNVTVQGKSEREIAGRDATCYEILDNDTNEVTTTCLDDDGVMLALIDGSEGGFSIEATEVSDDVSDSDFEPPYEITEIPGIGG